MKKLINLQERIFIAGASGMAGSSIKKNLLEAGYGLKENGGLLLTPSREKLDLSKKERVEEWFRKNKPTIVIIAAAKVGGILANSTKTADFLLENIKIQTNIIESAWENDTKRLLFLGSSCIYPKYAKQPIKEEELLNGPLERTNISYAIAKIAGIKLCEALREQYNFDSISLMPTNLYGPGDNYDLQSSHVVASLIRKFYFAAKNNLPEVICWGSGHPLREFMHVDDLAKSVIFALENWNPSNKNSPLDTDGNPLTFLNVGTSKEISIKDLSNLIAKEVGFQGNICWDYSKPDGTPRKNLDISRIRKLGWSPTIDLENGLRNTITDFSENIKNYT